MKSIIVFFLTIISLNLYASPQIEACAFNIEVLSLLIDDNEKITIEGKPISISNLENDFYQKEISLCPELNKSIIVKIRDSKENKKKFKKIKGQPVLSIVYVEVSGLYFEGKVYSNSFYDFKGNE